MTDITTKDQAIEILFEHDRDNPDQLRAAYNFLHNCKSDDQLVVGDDYIEIKTYNGTYTYNPDGLKTALSEDGNEIHCIIDPPGDLWITHAWKRDADGGIRTIDIPEERRLHSVGWVTEWIKTQGNGDLEKGFNIVEAKGILFNSNDQAKRKTAAQYLAQFPDYAVTDNIEEIKERFLLIKPIPANAIPNKDNEICVKDDKDRCYYFDRETENTKRVVDKRKNMYVYDQNGNIKEFFYNLRSDDDSTKYTQDRYRGPLLVPEGIKTPEQVDQWLRRGRHSDYWSLIEAQGKRGNQPPASVEIMNTLLNVPLNAQERKDACKWLLNHGYKPDENKGGSLCVQISAGHDCWVDPNTGNKTYERKKFSDDYYVEYKYDKNGDIREYSDGQGKRWESIKIPPEMQTPEDVDKWVDDHDGVSHICIEQKKEAVQILLEGDRNKPDQLRDAYNFLYSNGHSANRDLSIKGYSMEDGKISVLDKKNGISYELNDQGLKVFAEKTEENSQTVIHYQIDPKTGYVTKVNRTEDDGENWSGWKELPSGITVEQAELLTKGKTESEFWDVFLNDGKSTSTSTTTEAATSTSTTTEAATSTSTTAAAPESKEAGAAGQQEPQQEDFLTRCYKFVCWLISVVRSLWESKPAVEEKVANAAENAGSGEGETPAAPVQANAPTVNGATPAADVSSAIFNAGGTPATSPDTVPTNTGKGMENN